jgi:hypothetical protein
MRIYENNCVGCPPEIGCRGQTCPYINVPTDYCDVCKSEIAKYKIEGDDYCQSCATEFLSESFSTLSIDEKANLLELGLTDI